MFVVPSTPPSIPIVVFSEPAAQHCRSPSLSSNWRRRWPLRSEPPRTRAARHTEGFGGAVPFALRSSVNQTESKPDPQNQVPEERPPSGSNVLRALQRAAAEKSKRKKKKIKSKGTGISFNGGKEETALNYSKVRPLRIKSDWKTRLYELGKRLEELSDKY